MVKIKIDISRKSGNTVVLPITEKSKKFAQLDKNFFKDVSFKQILKKGKVYIIGSYKLERDSLKFGARLFRFLKNTKIDEVWIKFEKLNPKDVLIGLNLASYEFTKYKKDSEKEIKIHLVGSKEKFESIIKEVEMITESVFLARDLENEPANHLTPQKFVDITIDKLNDLENVVIRVFDENELKEMGFGGILAVGKGSSNPPRMLVIRYLNGERNEKPIALVGKGVCFDAGGIHLKPTGYIEDMKLDMSGAAVVLATIYAAAKLGIKKNIVGVIPLVENMPSGNAVKPGDIIKMYNGKTVEVVNTDAEGRLILADAIAYAEKRFQPEVIIDLATLTGAQIIALGTKIAAIMGNSKQYIKKLMKAGYETHEYIWKLPLPSFYENLVRGEISDVKNIPSPRSREAGCIVGGMFLKQFVKKTNWIHLDIAGPSIFESDWEWMTKGGTGFGVRLLLRFLQNSS